MSARAPFCIMAGLSPPSITSVGMVMLPPVLISLPFKLLLFVLVDGWYLVVRGLVLIVHERGRRYPRSA